MSRSRWLSKERTSKWNALFGCSLVVLLIQPAWSQESPAAVGSSGELRRYVEASDDSFHWEVRQRLRVRGCEVLRLHLTSQTWKGIPWKHVLYLIKPSGLNTRRSDALLLIAGGRWQSVWPDNGPEKVSVPGEAEVMAGVAQQFGCVIAVLQQVPFQPMLGDKYEDEIIAATFAKYIQTQQPDWPLLLPMVKSAVRGMDATTSAAKQEWDVQLDQFTVTGASKRGWTTWLTSAVDARVTALAPMVIDMLNMEVQMKHQLATWGDYSEQISDYTDLDLPRYLSTPTGQKLRSIVDPFAYRQRLRQPKLLIFGTNDRYWPVDACNNYWDELEGEKYLLYVPNQGHSIEDFPRVIGSITAVHRSCHGGPPLPELSWEFAEDAEKVMISVVAKASEGSGIDSVRGWTASSATKDFRDAKWRSLAARKSADDPNWTITVNKPDDGYLACFGEIVTIGNELPGFFSTNVKVFGIKHTDAP